MRHRPHSDKEANSVTLARKSKWHWAVMLRDAWHCHVMPLIAIVQIAFAVFSVLAGLDGVYVFSTKAKKRDTREESRKRGESGETTSRSPRKRSLSLCPLCRRGIIAKKNIACPRLQHA